MRIKKEKKEIKRPFFFFFRDRKKKKEGKGEENKKEKRVEKNVTTKSEKASFLQFDFILTYIIFIIKSNCKKEAFSLFV